MAMLSVISLLTIVLFLPAGVAYRLQEIAATGIFTTKANGNKTHGVDLSSLILLQAFNWESWRSGGKLGSWYNVVASQLDVMTQLNITDIWLPPVYESVADQGYLPSRLCDLDGSKYGNQTELHSLLRQIKSRGMRSIADIVINHRCGDTQDSSGKWNIFHGGGHQPNGPVCSKLDWGPWAIVRGDPFSDGSSPNWGTGEGFPPAPNIDHKNHEVQRSIIGWLKWMRSEIGFDAWRFDYVKGYGSEFVGKYVRESGAPWAVGELWGNMRYGAFGLEYNQDSHRQELCSWIDGTGGSTAAFDFTTKGILQAAVSSGEYWRLRDAQSKPSGLIGWYPQHAVTFIDNHDTGSTQAHWPFPGDKVALGYAYILSHPGIPSVFWDHAFDWGIDLRNTIISLVHARRSAGIRVDSPVHIHRAEQDLYFATVGDVLKVKLGSRTDHDVPPASSWDLAANGSDFAVWIARASDNEAGISETSAVSNLPNFGSPFMH